MIGRQIEDQWSAIESPRLLCIGGTERGDLPVRQQPDARPVDAPPRRHAYDQSIAMAYPHHTFPALSSNLRAFLTVAIPAILFELIATYFPIIFHKVSLLE